MERILSQRIAGAQPSFIREILKVAGQPGIISFAGGLPSPSLFPLAAIDDATRAVFEKDGPGSLQYGVTEGDGELREWIAARYRRRFGLEIPVEEILITNGSQQALDLLGRVLLDPGDALMMEAPGYLGAIQAFSMYQPRFLPLALGEDGIDVDAMQAALAREAPKLFYTVPNFHNPSGVSYSVDRRREVAALLAGRNSLLIEDDPYGELRFRGAEAPSFKQLLPEQTVLLGSFSKTVLPAFRLGWIAAPRWLMKRLVIAKQSADLHSSSFTQRVLYRYLVDNDFDAHLHRLIRTYGKQAQAMLDAITRHFPPEVTHTRPEGGMFLWATLPGHMSAVALFDRAIRRQVAFVPGHPFYLGARDSCSLRLNFTGADEAAIGTGIQRLADIIGEALRE